MVKAKFIVTSVEKFQEGTENESRAISLQAVIGTEGDNAEWSKWTPSGSISMHITNPGAFEQFEEGKQYYVEFEKVEEAAAGGEIAEAPTPAPEQEQKDEAAATQTTDAGNEANGEVDIPDAPADQEGGLPESPAPQSQGNDLPPVEETQPEQKDENQQEAAQ